MSTSGPLAGLRVVDLTDDLGRYATKLLAELGADVVKLGRGDRGPDLFGPDEPGLLDQWHDGRTRRVSLDLTVDADVERFRALVTRADILIEAEDPGALERLGLGVADLAELNPRLAHVSLTPYGSDGPKSDWKSSDLVAQAEGGWLSVTGNPDQPVSLWGRQAHTVGGFYAAICALAGVEHARATGKGTWFDLALHEAVISCSEHLLMYWWFPEALAPLGAPIADRQRSLHWIRAFEVVPCERGHCMVSPAAGGLVGLIAWLKERGHATEVPDDPDAEETLGLVPPMMQALHNVALETDATDLMLAGQSLHVPFGEAYDIPQVAACAQHEYRGFFRSVEGHEALRQPGPIAQFQGSPTGPARPAPSATTPMAEILEGWGSRAVDPVASAAAKAASSGPLDGVKIVDFTHVLAGPFATRVLGDLGADIIRVQTEVRSGGAAANEFPYNVMWARNKRSVQLEMKHPEALSVLRGLVEHADVVIDNFSAGILDSWGAGPDTLAEWNPKLVTMAMSGCGTEGPWADFVTYAPTVHALCGFTALTGPEGEADCGPGIAFNDHASGLAGATALLAALFHRNRTGEGQHVDLSQLEIGTYLVGPAVLDHFATGRSATSTGTADPYANHAFNDVVHTKDGDWIAITAEVGAQADALASTIGAVALTTQAVAGWAATMAASDAVAALQNVGVAAGTVQNARHLEESDAQLAHRDWLRTVESAMQGTQTTEQFPARVWTDSGRREMQLSYTAAPYLGEHNFEVYPELLGWDEVRVAEALGDELLQ